MRLANGGFSDFTAELNESVKLLPQDRLLAATLFRIWPQRFQPNWLTLLRMWLTPPIILTLGFDNFVWGIPLFLLAGLTDLLDGSLARVRRQSSIWGVVFDPVADKLLIGSVILTVVLQHVNFWLGLALILVETFIIIRAWRRLRHGQLKRPGWLGKTKMVLEVLAVLILLVALWLGADPLVELSAGTFALALVFALISLMSREP